VTLQLDPGYNPANSVNTSGSTSVSFTGISSANSNGKIFVSSITNGGGISGITTSGLTWASRKVLTVSGGFTEVWQADYTTALSSASVAVTLASNTYAVLFCWVISDNGNHSLAFDPAGVQGSTSTYASETTTVANTLVYGITRMSSTAAPVPGTGWSYISSVGAVANSFCVPMYQVNSSTGTATLSNTGATDCTSSIIDAVVLSGGGGGFTPVFRRTRSLIGTRIGERQG
jgi:hypothetical protein